LDGHRALQLLRKVTHRLAATLITPRSVVIHFGVVADAQLIAGPVRFSPGVLIPDPGRMVVMVGGSWPQRLTCW
jgi:hypothetical protein